MLRMVKIALWALLFVVAWYSAESRTVRVATFNIENGIPAPGSTKYEAVRSILIRLDADVIGFQELLRNSSTVDWEDHWRELAAELGYFAEMGRDGTSMSGSQRLGYFSRYPITDVAHIRSPSPANEMTRLPMRITVEVPGAAKPLVLWNMHHKANEGTAPSTLARNQFRRAVEAFRIVQDIDQYRAMNPDHDEFIVLGDLNADVFSEPQFESFDALPEGLPSSYRLGEDITFPVFYRFFPDDAYADAGGGMDVLDAFQQNSEIRYTYPSWPSVLDYIIVSTRLFENAPDPPVGEVYNSARDALFPDSGLPKVGPALSSGTSSIVSDHFPVFTDIVMTPAADPSFTVSPFEAQTITGLPGSVFQPSSLTYTFSNSVFETFNWTTSVNVPWLQVSATSGSIPPAALGEVTVSLITANLPQQPGLYFGSLRTQDQDSGEIISRTITLQVLQPGRLTVSPSGGALAAGPREGPFTPSSFTYQLINTGQDSIIWQATTAEPWLNIPGASGELLPGTFTNVQVEISAPAETLDEGIYSATIFFLNLSNEEGNTTRTITLEVGTRDYFTAFFTNGIPLAGQAITFTPTGGPNYYRACMEPIERFPSDPSGTSLSLSDDSFFAIDLGSGTNVNVYGTSYNRIFIGSNGYLTFGSGDSTFRPSLQNHFRLPRISTLYTDLNPAQGGSITYRLWPDRVAISFIEVPEFGRSNAHTFQAELFYDGRIRLSYLRIDALAAIVGLSSGNGVPLNFADSAFPYASCQLSPLGIPVASNIGTNSATLASAVLPVDRSNIAEYGFVISRLIDQSSPTLLTLQTLVVPFIGVPPETIITSVSGLLHETDYRVRSYLIRNGEAAYSEPTDFVTASVPDANTIIYFTGFENASKTAYASGNITIDGILWNLDEAMIGRDAGDMKNGARSARIRNGIMTMLADMPQGIGRVSFLYARSNFSNDRTDSAPVFVMEYSTDQGTTWHQAGSITSLSGIDTLTLFEANVQVSQPARIRIRTTGGASTKRWNLDDLTINAYVPSLDDTPLTITGDLFVQGRVGETFLYTITANRPPEVFEAEDLAPGLMLDDSNGRISGIPTTAGRYDATLFVSQNGEGESVTLIMDIERGVPVVLAPPAASDLFAGQTLSSSLLTGGNADVPGNFDFEQPQTVPPVGVSTHPVVFTPQDSTNFAATVILITVNVLDASVPSSFAEWSQGAEVTDELLRQYAIGGALSPNLTGVPPELTVDGDFLFYTVLIRIHDPDLSVRGLAVNELAKIDDPESVQIIAGIPDPDQTDVLSGFERTQFRLETGDHPLRFLGLEVLFNTP
jgi:endonuclease/exonuclease/phosphatase family metal-dependent hydrolase